MRSDMKRILALCLLAFGVTAASAQITPRVITTASDPNGNACTATTPPTILLYNSGSTFTTYICTSSTWSAVSAGTGDVTGPGSSTDNAIVRFDGTGGKTLQGYSSNTPTITDAGAASFPGGVSSSGDASLTGSLDIPTSASEPTCSASTLGDIERIETTAQWPYTAVCASDGAGGYVWTKLYDESSDGFVGVDFTPEYYTSSVDAVTTYTVTDATPVAYPIGVLSDGALYGSGRTDWSGGTYDYGDLFKSTDGGKTWSKISDLTSVIGTGPNCSLYSSPPCASNMTNIMDAGDGEVLVTTRFEVLKSSGWAGGSPTWSIVKEPSADDTTSVDYRATILPWALDTWGDYAIFSEYVAGPSVGWNNSNHVYLSTDNGDNWSEIYDLSSVEPATKNHIHGVAIDPWVMANGTPRLWFSHHNSTGGGPASANAYLNYSDDAGSTWTKLDALQPTTIRAAKYGVVLGADYEPEGMQRVLRRDAASDMTVEYIVEFPWESGSSGFSRTAWRDPRNGIVYDAFGAIVADAPSHVQVSDGRVGAVVYYHLPTSASDQNTFWGAWVTWASGEDILIVSADDNGTDKYYTMKAPYRGEMPDRQRNKGHLWPVAARPGAGSTAAGLDADATGTYATAFGYRTEASDQGTVAIGYKAAAVEPYSVVIGELASQHDTSSSDVVVIGDDAVGAFENVVIGSGASSTGAASVVLGPDIANTQSNNVLIGKGTSATFGSNVVIGNTATNAHAAGRGVSVGYGADSLYRSIAIGYNAVSGVQDSVAIGDTASCDNTKNDCTVIGYNASSLQSNQTIIGKSASGNASASSSVVIGDDASATQTNCTAIGSGSSCASGGSVALGQGVSTDAANQVAIGDRNIKHQDSGGFDGTIAFPAESADRTWTFPDQSGTIAMTSDITGGGATYVYKSSSETINSDTTNSNDSALTFSMSANTTYRVRVVAFWESVTAADIKFSIACPTSPTTVRMVEMATEASTPTLMSPYGTRSFCGWSGSVLAGNGTGAAGNKFMYQIEGIIDTGANSGTFALTWSQNTSDVGDTTVEAGSYIEYEVLP